MKLPVTLFVLMVSADSSLSARTWSDTNGRSMEAETVRADETKVTVSKDGKEFELPLTKLSESDQEFVADWLEKQQEAALPKVPGEITFDGKPLLTGGKVNTYEFDYSPEQLSKVRKAKGTDTGYKIAMTVPADFDPSKAQKVFIVNTAVNDEKQGRAGNAGIISFFSKQCTQNGWVCLTYDTNLGRANHDTDLVASWDKLNAVWPGFSDWQYAVGGFSGGAKACFWPCAYLLKIDYKVAGVFLAGCNQDMSQAGKDAYGPSKSAYKDLKVYLSTRNMQKPEAVAEGNGVAASLKKNGMQNVRHELHGNAQSLNYDHFIAALKWFGEAK